MPIKYKEEIEISSSCQLQTWRLHAQIVRNRANRFPRTT